MEVQKPLSLASVLTSMGFKPANIKQASLRRIVKSSNRRISAEAIQKVDELVGKMFADLAKQPSDKKTIDADHVASFGSAIQQSAG